MKIYFLIAAVIVFASFPQTVARAQLVADGATLSVNGTSKSVSGDLTVGTNGSFTTLIFTNAATCTNTGNGVIGLNSTAKTNKVIVTGTGSVWGSGGNLLLGSLGFYSSLIVSNGGRVVDNFGNIAFNGGGNCSVLVTGTNSIWTNSANINIGNTGSQNVVTATNSGTIACASVMVVGNGGGSNQLNILAGGKMVSGSGGKIGATSTSSGNVVVVSGSNSMWMDYGEFDIGPAGSLNQMYVSNGATINSTGTYIGANAAHSGNGIGGLLYLSGTNTLWNDLAAFGLGNYSSSNLLVISNGAVLNVVLPSQDLFISTQATSSNNIMVVTGTNSMFLGNSGELSLGQNGPDNQLIISKGGSVVNGPVYIGQDDSSSNNMAVVADPGSTWNIMNNLMLGEGGPLNQIIITNGGFVQNYDALIGSSSGNSVLVTGTNSLWTNSGNIYIGYIGASNRLVVTNSGIVGTPSNIFVGFFAGSNNTVTLSGGTLQAMNYNTCLTDVRRGSVTVNSGTLATDFLLLTNGTQSGFTFNGGSVQVDSVTASNGAVFAIGNGRSNATLLLNGFTSAFGNGLLITSNALLDGVGVILGNVTNGTGGTLFGGEGIAQFTINGNLVLNPGSTNNFALSKAFGNTSTRILGINSVTYGGTLVASNLSGTLTSGSVFKLFTATNYSGVFGALLPATPGNGLRWSTNELDVDGTLRVAKSPTPAPKITSLAITNANHLAIHAGNGVPFEPVYLRTATNMATPLTNWSYMTTNFFDSNANAVLTIQITNNEPKRFFILQVQ